MATTRSRRLRRRRNPNKKRLDLNARTTNRHELYEKAVQAPEAEIDIVTRIFKRRTGRAPLSLREDFAGTANLCAAWVRSHRERTATGIDLDRPTLEWGRWHNLASLGEEAWRVTLRCQDVRDPVPGEFDLAIAFNYSYQVFKTRDDLRGYFQAVRSTLKRDGLLFLDAMGGWEARMPLEEERREDGFWYVWDQDFYNPIDSNLICHIHFRFDDGSEMRKAFTYDWRLWQLVELKELLLEAGFARADVYWEDEDEERNETGRYRIRRRVQNDPGWNCYVVAQNHGS